MDVAADKIELLESLLKSLTDAAYSTLCASNAIEDAGSGYEEAIGRLDAAYETAQAYFEPVEAEKTRKWKDACATASYIMQRFREDRTRGLEHPNLLDSHLVRNIADAINGTLVQTFEERERGTRPATMSDHLTRLVADGTLTPVQPQAE